MSDLPYGYVVTINQDGSADPASSPRNQWQILYEELPSWIDLPGETSESYTIREQDQGSGIRLKQSFGAEESGTANLYSNALQVTNVTPPGGGTIGEPEEIALVADFRVMTQTDNFIYGSASLFPRVDPGRSLSWRTTDGLDWERLVWDEDTPYGSNLFTQWLEPNSKGEVWCDSYLAYQSMLTENGPEPDVFKEPPGSAILPELNDGRDPLTWSWRNDSWMRRIRYLDNKQPGPVEYLSWTSENFNDPNFVLSSKKWPDDILALFQDGSISSYIERGWWHPTEDYGFLKARVPAGNTMTWHLWRIDGDMLDVNNWTLSATEMELNGEIRTITLGDMKYIDGCWYMLRGGMGAHSDGNSHHNQSAPYNKSDKSNTYYQNWKSTDGGASWQVWGPVIRQSGRPCGTYNAVHDLKKIGNSYAIVVSNDYFYVYDDKFPKQDNTPFHSSWIDGPYKEIKVDGRAYNYALGRFWGHHDNVLILGSLNGEMWRFLVT